MGYFYGDGQTGEKVPFTNMHELNLDWIINRINEFDARLNEVLDTGFAKAKEYTDKQIAIERQQRIDQYNELNLEFLTMKNDIERQLAELNSDMDSFKDLVDAKIVFIQREMEEFKKEVREDLTEIIDQADQMMNIKIEDLLNSLPESVVKRIRVLNFFTGELVTLQEMFDYLSVLHIDNGLSYEEIGAKNKTYDELAALKVTWTQIIVNGKIIIV